MEVNLERTPQATVIGDSDASLEACGAAEKIGAMLARLGVAVITGGRAGVMEAACRGAREAGGFAIGILPSIDKQDANRWCSFVIPTGLGHARNVLTVLSGDFLIAIGGAAGTLSEICFAWIHGKPIFVLTEHGGWSAQIADLPLDQRHTSTIVKCSSLEELERAVIAMCRNLNLTVRS